MPGNPGKVIQLPVVLVTVLGMAFSAVPTLSVAAMSPDPAAAPAAKDKPKPKRRAAKRAPTPAPEAAAAVPAAPVINPKYNDVMTPVLMRDYAGAAEILQAGAWVDRSDRNGETPLMPWITSTSPGSARWCASISPKPDTLRSPASLF